MLKYVHVYANWINVEHKLFLYILLDICTKLSVNSTPCFRAYFSPYLHILLTVFH